MTAWRLIVLAFVGVAVGNLSIVTVIAEEHWPGPYVKWPQKIVGYTPPSRWFVPDLMRGGFRPYYPGQLIRTDPYGSYLFKTCADLAAFVNDGVVHPGVIPIRPSHVVRVMQLIPADAGLVHDELYGDGFIMMAHGSDPYLTIFKDPNPEEFYARHMIVRKSMSDQRRWDRLLRGERENTPTKLSVPSTGATRIGCN